MVCCLCRLRNGVKFSKVLQLPEVSFDSHTHTHIQYTDAVTLHISCVEWLDTSIHSIHLICGWLVTLIYFGYYCPSMAFLPVQPHCPNARWNRFQEDLNSFPFGDWRRPPGCPHTTWMKTTQQDLKSNNLSLNEAIDVAQNRPLWRLMSTFGAMHFLWCLTEMNEWVTVCSVKTFICCETNYFSVVIITVLLPN